MAYGTNASDLNTGDLQELPPPVLVSSSFLPVLAAAFALTIFIIDIATPLDIAIAVLYSVVVLMASTVCQRRGVFLVASACLTLTVLSYLAQHTPAADSALVRCLMSLSAI